MSNPDQSNPDSDIHRLTPNVDFIVGDKVFVNGIKAGQIAFLGETKFAAGVWAGIVLDEPTGKNDGSVAGVRYFQTESKRGLFSRPSKLTRSPVEQVSNAMPPPSKPPVKPATATKTKVLNATASKSGIANGASTVNGATKKVRQSGLPTPRRSSIASSVRTSPASSVSSIPAPSLNLSQVQQTALSVGDRVAVLSASGNKVGVLRYLGSTDFAKGEWAGIELDAKVGKNDGSVAGKRYFTCESLFGLFAPVHKVRKIGDAINRSNAQATTPRLPGAIASTPQGSLVGVPTPTQRTARTHRLCSRSGSMESLNSVSSAASSTAAAARSRVRLGVTSLSTAGQASPRVGAKKAPIPISGPAGLQKALKEKEEHIEQLLRERDMERSEIARAASQADQAEGMLSALRSEYTSYREQVNEEIAERDRLIEQLQTKELDLTSHLEDAQSKIEELEFTVEEQTINLQQSNEMDESKEIVLEQSAELEKLRDSLMQEQLKVAQLNKDITALRDKESALELKSTELEAERDGSREVCNNLRDESAQLTKQLAEISTEKDVLHSRLAELESRLLQSTESCTDSDNKMLELTQELAAQKELVHRTESDLESSKQQTVSLEKQLTNANSELSDIKEENTQLETVIVDLRAKNDKSSKLLDVQTTENAETHAKLSDVDKQLVIAEERCSRLFSDKSSLESQLEELTRCTGDSSQQLTLLNEQLREKDRLLESSEASASELRAELSQVKEQLDSAKHEAAETIERIKNDGIEQSNTHQKKISDLEESLSKLETEFKQQLAELIENHRLCQVELETKLQQSKEEIKAAELKFMQQLSEKEDQINKIEAEYSDTISSLNLKKAELDEDYAKLSSTNFSLEQKITEQASIIESLEEQIKSLKDIESTLRQSVVDSEARASSLETNVDIIKSQLDEANDNLSATKSEKLSIDEKLTTTEAALNDAKASHQEVSAKLEQLQVVSEQLKSTNKDLDDKCGRLEETLHDKDGKIKVFQEQVEKIKGEFLDLQEKLRRYQDESVKTEKEMAALRAELTGAQAQLTNLTDRLSTAETERDEAMQQLDSMQQIAKEKKQIEVELQKVKDDFNEAIKREASLLERFESERKEFKDSLTDMEKRLQQKDADVEEFNQQILALRGELALLNDYKQTNSSLQKDKKLLEERVSDLQFSLEESKLLASGDINMNEKSAPLQTLREENEDLTQQVSFLNSVIVDLNTKNEALCRRVHLLDTGEYVDGDDSLGDESPRHAPVAVRLYCDICEVFDQHDTEECPAQSMDEPEQSHHGGERGVQRPFCANCEVFGHDTADCTEEETF